MNSAINRISKNIALIVLATGLLSVFAAPLSQIRAASTSSAHSDNAKTQRHSAAPEKTATSASYKTATQGAPGDSKAGGIFGFAAPRIKENRAGEKSLRFSAADGLLLRTSSTAGGLASFDDPIFFRIDAPSQVIAGQPFNFTVTATDFIFGTMTDYRGTIRFGSNDPAASLPADYTFTSSDNGSHTFTATLNTFGTFNISVSDINSQSFAVPSQITVKAAALVDLKITKMHFGNFTRAFAGGYFIDVSNIGGQPSSGTVTVKDNLPAGLTATEISGIGWDCTLSTLICTRSDALPEVGIFTYQYPSIILRVEVAANAPASVVNTATVSGGGDADNANNTASDPTIIEGGLNNAPVAGDDNHYVTPRNTTLNVSAPGVLGNDSDADGNGLSSLLVSPPANGSLTLRANGSFDYTPSPNFQGMDSFAYKANDGTADSNVATVRIAVVPTSLAVTKIEDTNDGRCDSDCSLREAIANAATGDSIVFSSFFNQERQITLSPDAGFRSFVIDKNLTITGKGANLTTVRRDPNAAAQFRIFQIKSGAQVTISGLTIAGGSAENGGGILNEGSLWLGGIINQSVFTPDGVHVTGNAATASGGGIFNGDGAQLFVLNSAVSDNTAGGNSSGASVGAAGGGIANQGGWINVFNSTVSGNSVTGGSNNAGGILSASGTVNVSFSTVAFNQAVGSPSAGGVYNNNASVALDNSIVAANNHNNSAMPDVNGNAAFSSQGANLIGNAPAGVAFVNGSNLSDQIGGNGKPIIDPRLAPLALNGGKTPTHALRAGSPAIDKGHFDGISGIMRTDQRGLTRPVDLDNARYPNFNPQANGSDIGAFELQTLPPLNTAPQAISQTVGTNEDTGKAIVLIASDAENNALTYTVTAQPTHGTLSGTAPNLIYTPAANYNGADAFKFKASDDFSDSNEATVSINIAAVNDPPQMSGLPSSPTVNELAAYTFTASAGDVDSPANSLAFSLIGAPSGASITPAGVFTWTPTEAHGAGTYNFTIRLSDGADYSEQGLTIKVAEVNTAPTLAAIGNFSKTWSETLSFAVEASDSDVLAGGAKNNLTYSLAPGTAPGAGVSLAVPSGATINPATGAFGWNIGAAQIGTHRFKVVVTDDGSPALGDAKEFTVTVNKADQTINWTPPAAITYGAMLSATQLNATVAGIDNQTPTGALSYNPAAGAVLNAGQHTLTVTAAETAHYNAASASVSLTVNKAPMTVKAVNRSKTYGEAPVRFVVTYIGLFDPPSSLGGTLTFNFADSTATPAGTYTITPSGLTSDNYAIAFQNGTLTVNKANLTVKADDKAKTYGAANPALTGAITGIQNSDQITAAYSTAAVNLSNAGNYSIVPSVVDPTGKLSNYNLTVTNGTLTVNKAEQTISWSNPSAIIYGTPLSAAQLNASVAGVSGGTAPGALTYTPAAGTVLNAGAQTLTVTAAATTNYNQASFSVPLVVNKAALIVKADNKQKIIGAAAVAFTVSYFGFVNNDTAANSLRGALAFNFADSTATPAGSYTITPSGLTSSNYSITFQSGTLSVSYAVEALFDQNAYNAPGDTVQIKLKTVDAAGNNLSHRNLPVTAITARLLPNGTPFEVANEPRNATGAPGDFTFTEINRAPGYLFRLKTDVRWATGTYEVSYRVGNDPATHTVQFRLGGNR